MGRRRRQAGAMTGMLQLSSRGEYALYQSANAIGQSSTSRKEESGCKALKQTQNRQKQGQ
jgi:hypothetical protein